MLMEKLSAVIHQYSCFGEIGHCRLAVLLCAKQQLPSQLQNRYILSLHLTNQHNNCNFQRLMADFSKSLRLAASLRGRVSLHQTPLSLQ